VSNVFVALPQPAGNGPGAGVDASSMGAYKTIVIGSSGGVYEPVTTIEVSNDGTNWSPLTSFTGPDTRTVLVACDQMRMNVSRFIDGTVPVVDVGAPRDSVYLSTLVATAGNGSGASVDTSSMGLAKTVQVTGPFMGTVNIDISEDGGSTWATQFSFIPGSPGIQSAIVVAELMRVTRSGVPVVSPGLPTVVVAATAIGDDGGGGNRQAFIYTATGSETSAGFTVNLPFPRASSRYGVLATGAGLTDLLSFDCPSVDYTVNSFFCIPSANLTLGDKIFFLVEDLT